MGAGFVRCGRSGENALAPVGGVLQSGLMIKFVSFFCQVAAAVVIGLAGTVSSDAAVAYWSFQTDEAGATGTLNVTGYNGFATAPTIVTSAGTATGTSSMKTGTGGVQYNSPVNGSHYAGTDIGVNNVTSGNSMYWATSQTVGAALTGASFTVTLATTGLTDLTMQFDIRSATAQAGTPAPGAFSAMEYSLNGTDWISLGVTSPTWAHSTSTLWDRTPVLDFSGVDAIENQSSVQLRFTFEDSGVAAGESPANMNVRVDNLVITAVPEPGSVMLLGLAAVSAVVRRRR